MASGLSASIDSDEHDTASLSPYARTIGMAAPKASTSGLVIPFKIPVKGKAQVPGIEDNSVPIITTPTPPPAPQVKGMGAASNTQQAADLAAKLVTENPENALKILEQQEQ